MTAKYTCGKSQRWLLAFILVGLIVLSLWSLFCSAADIDFLRILQGRQFHRALWNSITVSSFSTFLSLLIGNILFWATSARPCRAKNSSALSSSCPCSSLHLAWHGTDTLVRRERTDSLSSCTWIAFSLPETV